MSKLSCIDGLLAEIEARQHMLRNARSFDMGKVYEITVRKYIGHQDHEDIREVVKIHAYNGDSIRFMVLASPDRDPATERQWRRCKDNKEGQIFDTFHLNAEYNFAPKELKREDMPTYVGWKYVSPYFNKILKGESKCQINKQ